MKYKCLVLDHDDTAVASEVSVNYPCFLLMLDHFRPGEEHMSYEEFVWWCFHYDFGDFLRVRYGFTEEELAEEYRMWKEYAAGHIPAAYEGIREILQEQKRRGGLVCVASLSGRDIIIRDYRTHFGMEPDLVFCADDPREQRKPSTYPLETIMKTYDLSPADLLMVDDLPIGRDMAKAAGVKTAFAGWGRKNSPELCREMEESCDHSFYSGETLKKFLFGEDTSV